MKKLLLFVFVVCGLASTIDVEAFWIGAGPVGIGVGSYWGAPMFGGYGWAGRPYRGWRRPYRRFNHYRHWRY